MRNRWPNASKSGRTNVVTEFTYADYQDWNNPLNKVEAFHAGTLVERRNGAVLRDVTTVETETGNVYVVMPVPASVKNAPAAPNRWVFTRAVLLSRTPRQPSENWLTLWLPIT